ncbi:50S ribosomal protein L15 [Pseudolysinimonas sp.]|uniref:50S ribosomal protein L15 n=1 Tax=Pseudolysinimonas sp. TaxID=2680009 RepID=UPI00286D69EE|nr:50S ribosomal protein L15 [Pseudolysinimonas sp.]
MAEETTPKKAPAKAAAPKAAAEKAAPKAAAPKKDAAEKAAPKAAAAKTAAPKAAAPKAAAAKDETAAEKPATKSTASKASAAKAAPKKDAAPSRPQVLKAHHLRPAAGAKKDRMRVGRGEGSKGKTAGRGTKGTKARYQVRVGLEGGNLNSIMRAPKLRGFKNPFRVEYQVVNLERLAELYPKGGDVTIGDLIAKGAVRKNEKVKVLGTGDIAVKLNVAVDKVSNSAELKIVAAGGSVK